MICSHRVVGRSAYFSETFLAVMYDVRYLLFYIVYSAFSASLCVAILYKNDEVSLLVLPVRVTCCAFRSSENKRSSGITSIRSRVPW